LAAKPTLAWPAEVAVSQAETAPSPDHQQAALRARFASLFQEFAPYVMRVLPRMGVADRDLDDVVQEVFLAVYRALPSFEGRSSERTWVYGICIRTCSNYRQRAHRRHEQLPGNLPEATHSATPERALQTRTALAQLDAALATVQENDRVVFVLFEIEQLTVLEIAEALGCSKFTVYTRLYRARRAVSARMCSEQEAADA
jgi:RNA polymerase sigma-70 factor (ECF subfamily)